MSKYIFLQKHKDFTCVNEEITRLDFEAESLQDLMDKFHAFLIACGYGVEGKELQYIDKDEDGEYGEFSEE